MDSQFTIDMFCNHKHLKGIQKVEVPLVIHCTIGIKHTNLKETLTRYYLVVWFLEAGIANILLLSRVKAKFRVMYNSAVDNCFHVHKKTTFSFFKKHQDGFTILTWQTGQNTK